MAGFFLTKFHVPKSVKGTKAALAKGYAKVAKELQRDLKAAVSTPGPGPSVAGNPPHKQTGVLQRSIKVTAPKSGDGVTLRSVKYGVYLEDPAATGLNRKWIRPTIKENRAKYVKIVRTTVKKLAKKGRVK